MRLLDQDIRERNKEYTRRWRLRHPEAYKVAIRIQAVQRRERFRKLVKQEAAAGALVKVVRQVIAGRLSLDDLNVALNVYERAVRRSSKP